MFRRVLQQGLLRAAAVATVPSADSSNLTLLKGRHSELEELSPRKIAEVLDSYIIGQSEGKKAVAIALRNRWRRKQLTDEAMQREVMPKNILLIGPTGVGKTEISRRMARITDAPFVKVEATKYTEVGFKGKDVESIIEDLYSNAKIKAKKAISSQRAEEAEAMAVDIVYSNWIVRRQMKEFDDPSLRNASAATDGVKEDGAEGGDVANSAAPAKKSRKTKEKKKKADETAASLEEVTLDYFREHYKTKFKDDMVTIELTSANPAPKLPSSLQNTQGDIQWIGALVGMEGEGKKTKTQVTKKVSEAVPLATQEALEKLTDERQVKTLAQLLAEEEGVVFIDEIDKVVAEPNSPNSDISSTGVQQDLLPLVEGCSVTLKDGTVIQTDNILFICSGAFHTVKASDMLAELQGRLPVRVELKALAEEDFQRILTEPKFNLLEQQLQLLKTEGVELVFTEDGIKELARVTCLTNTQGQNIGARRLNTVLERVMDSYSFKCEDFAGQTVRIDAGVVKQNTEKLLKNMDLAKYLL